MSEHEMAIFAAGILSGWILLALIGLIIDFVRFVLKNKAEKKEQAEDDLTRRIRAEASSIVIEREKEKAGLSNGKSGGVWVTRDEFLAQVIGWLSNAR